MERAVAWQSRPNILSAVAPRAISQAMHWRGSVRRLEFSLKTVFDVSQIAARLQDIVALVNWPGPLSATARIVVDDCNYRVDRS